MQIVLSHFAKVSLKTNNKSKNGKLIENLLGICDYRATEKQREQLMQNINESNYRTMKNNLVAISDDCKDVPSTNILDLFNNLEVYNKKWITSTNRAIEK